MELPEPTTEQVKLGRKVARQRWALNKAWANLNYVRLALGFVGFVWVLLLPHRALWKTTWVDENALSPAQATVYYDWADVHRADQYLDDIEKLGCDASWDGRKELLLHEFANAGVEAGNTTDAVWARVTPPRSEGTEALLVSANWLSRDEVCNKRGVALLLSLADFLRSQNHWAFDIYLVAGDGYLHGLNDFMTAYHPRANIWNAINIDYPYHSFESIGQFYEGINGRLPNLDVLSSVSRTTRWSAGVTPGIHDLGADLQYTYKNGAKTLWEHFKFAALGRPSAAGGIMAKHRIDAITLYGLPAEGPHGFFTMGKAVESTLRTFNNLLERLHASFFFYLLPSQEQFLPVGHYLPSAVLLGASVTLGGFDCPDPLAGVAWAIPAFVLAAVGWFFQTPLVAPAAFLFPRPTGASRQSLSALAHLAYGALIPTLAMVNYPQALLLAFLVIVALAPLPRVVKIMLAGINPAILAAAGIDLRGEWEMLGNVAWPAIFAVWLPLAGVSAMI